MHKIKETVEFNFNDVKVFVKIDYLNNRIDIVEPVNLFESSFTLKKWVFAGRGVEYMNGWLNVLEAIKLSIKEAKLMYEKNLAEESKFREIKIGELILKGEGNYSRGTDTPTCKLKVKSNKK